MGLVKRGSEGRGLRGGREIEGGGGLEGDG